MAPPRSSGTGATCACTTIRRSSARRTSSSGRARVRARRRAAHGRYRSAARTAFMLGCLRDLDASLRERGSGLVVRHGRPADELVALAGEAGARAVLWTSDVAPYARARDTRVTEALREAGVEPLPCTRRLLHRRLAPAHEGRQAVHGSSRRSGGRGARSSAGPCTARRPRFLRCPARCARVACRGSTGSGWRTGTSPEPVVEAGEPAGARGAGALARRPRRALRGPPRHASAGGTSALSPYLRWGCLSARECEARAGARGGARRGGLGPPARAGATSTPTSCCCTPRARRRSCRSATAAR